MNNKIKKINLNHSFIFFLFCNIFSLITFIFNDFTISPLICLLLILSIGISHGSLDNIKGKKLFKIFKIIIFLFFIYIYFNSYHNNNLMDNYPNIIFNNFLDYSLISLW